jgi:spore coat protein U-like protein
MKKYLVLLAAVMMVIAMVSGAFAASPTNVDVTASATVTSNCEVTPGTLAFGLVDADHGSSYTVTAAGLSIKCTTGTAVIVSDNNGVRGDNTMTDGTHFLPYSTTYNPSLTGGGTGTSGTELATALGFTGTITMANLSGVVAGVYGDTIQLTLTY